MDKERAGRDAGGGSVAAVAAAAAGTLSYAVADTGVAAAVDRTEAGAVATAAASLNGDPNVTIPRYVYQCAFCASVNSALLGYDIGVAGGAMFVAKSVLDLSDMQTEIILAALNLFAIPGAVLARPISDNLGRTRTLALASALFLAGSLFMALAGGFWTLLVGRMVLGFGVGAGLSIDPLYISEIAPAGARGKLVSWSELAINAGIMLGFVATVALEGLDPDASWRVMFALGAVMPIGMLYLATQVMPETPRFLFEKGREAECLRVTGLLTNSDAERDAVIADLSASKARRDQRIGGVDTFCSLLAHTDAVVRRMLLVVCAVAVAQQLSGVEAFMYYTPFMLEDVGFSERSEILGMTAAMGIAKTATLVLVLRLLDRPALGRRRMLIGSYCGMAVALVVLAWGAFTTSRGVLVLGIFGYVVSFSIGAGPITWLFASEIMPTSIRARGMALAASLNRVTGCIISLTFLSLTGTSAGGTLAFFAVVCCLFACTSYRYAPETAGKTLEEMYAVFAGLLTQQRGAGDEEGTIGLLPQDATDKAQTVDRLVEIKMADASAGNKMEIDKSEGSTDDNSAHE